MLPKLIRPERLLGPLLMFLSLLSLISVLAGSASAQEVEYDLVVRNGRVFDGAGNPWVLADVAIQDGRFASVGKVSGKGKREIDATGHYVSPGWIDMMDQSGSVLLRNGLADNKLRMGVTTAIGGEGGTPSADGTENPSDGAKQVSHFFKRLENQGISLNFGSYFSATQARVAVVGMDSRAPTPQELDAMRKIIRQAMEAGALGMTTALIYPPSSYATTDELVELAKVVSEYGGLYASHIRGEGPELIEAVEEAIEIGERGGVPVEIFHFKAAYEPGWGSLMQGAIGVINAARERGVDVAADLYPYTAGGTGLEVTIPSWAHEGGMDALRERLADPEVRARLKTELETGSPGWSNMVQAAGGWQNIVLVNAHNPKNASFQTMTIAEIAKQTGKHPADTAWDLVLEGSGRVMAIFHMMSEADIQTALQEPWVSIGSDAGASLSRGGGDDIGLPHPRAFGTHPRVLSHFVRETGTLSLAEAIRRMTSWPATRMGLFDRGLIREGMWADVVIFDADKVKDVATYDQPTLDPEGIPYVIVNGQLVIDGARHTGAKPGKVLWGPGTRNSRK